MIRTVKFRTVKFRTVKFRTVMPGAMLLAIVVSVLSGCVQPEDAGPSRTRRSAGESASREGSGGERVESKLARVGLELITERDAAIPRDELGRYVPCRVRAGAAAPLPPDPAGYLIVGFDRQLADDASTILAALDRWRVGETLSLWVRRNPYLAAEPDWWEVNDLPVKLP